MKMNSLVVLIVLFLAGVQTVNAQNVMKVHLKNGETSTFPLSDIDYVDWEESQSQFEDININGVTYHLGISGAVDLGLSVKWATCNVGADAPGDYGDYYAWGETETKSTYGWETYKYMQEGYSDWQHVTKYTTADGKTYCCWYNGSSYIGTTVNGVTYKNKTVLDPEDDVAHVKWGGDWRMPTKAEQDELRKKCGWVWTTYGGHNGYVVVGPNGNAIFLPAAGCRLDSDLLSAGSDGLYWSSSLNESYSYFAYYLYFFSEHVDCARYERDFGQSVRAVCP